MSLDFASEGFEWDNWEDNTIIIGEYEEEED